jgi:WD40 repeat protein
MNLTSESSITDVIISDAHKYFLVSTLGGEILMYKYTSSNRLMHSFEGHTRSCTALELLPQYPGMFLSTGLDATFRIWSIDSFQQVYSFKLNLAEGLVNALLTADNFFLILEHSIYVGKMNLVGSCLGLVKSKVEAISCTENPNEIVSLNSDNSCIVFNVGGAIRSTIYPPPTAKSVIELHYHKTLIYLLLSSGTI